MMPANEAREKTLKAMRSIAADELKEIEKLISGEIYAGMMECKIPWRISKETMRTLENMGYTVLINDNAEYERTFVSWEKAI